MAEEEKKWHFNKEIPISLVAALVIQFIGLVWYASYQIAAVESRISAVEYKVDADASRINQLAANNDKIIRLETKVENLTEISKEIRDNLVNRRP